MNSEKIIQQAYEMAIARYAAYGVDVERAVRRLEQIPLSLHCWQGDDVGGFENPEAGLSGGLAATGNYPGKARTLDELRQDLDVALSIIPGRHRLNLHAIYADTGGKKIERSDLEPKHFASWIQWAKQRKMGLDFNPTCFSHPMAADGFTLSHQDKGIRDFWIEHCIACRKIGAAMGKALGTPTVTNVWIPDGCKDLPVDRKSPRERLKASLDAVFREKLDPKHNLDSIEGKLFGIGSESYVVGSHEFYLGYAIENRKLVCLDSGHYHPTETIADKISSVLLFLDEILLHVSRGVRWDSDHVTILNDDLRSIAEEIVRGGFLARVHIGLDYFDASINRVAAWAIGARCMLKALLIALLEPAALLRKFETSGDFTSRLALLEELKTMPFGPIWDYYCLRRNVPVGDAWLAEIKNHERNVLAKRRSRE